MTIRRLAGGAGALLALALALGGCGVLGGGGGGAAPEEPDPSAPGAIKAADLNYKQTDPGLDVDISVQKIGEFQPAMPTTPTDPGGTYIRMIGVRIASDVTHSPYIGVTPYPAAFALIAADNQRAECQELNTKGPNATQSAAILAAIGGDKMYDHVGGGDKPEGWMICLTSRSSDASFNQPGIVLKYARAAAIDSKGGNVPLFTFTVPIGA